MRVVQTVCSIWLKVIIFINSFNCEMLVKDSGAIGNVFDNDFVISIISNTFLISAEC